MTKFKAIATLAGLVGSCFAVWYITASYKDGVWSGKLEAIKREIVESNNKALETALEKEREARTKAANLEVQYLDQIKDYNAMALDNQRLVNELGGLRDPNFATIAPGAGSGGNAPGSASNCPAAGQLSKQTSAALFALAAEADEMSAYAWTCYQWINRNAPGAMPRP